MASALEKIFTTADIYTLPEGTRAELIDGQIYYMAPPSRKHQALVGELYSLIHDYIRKNHGAWTTKAVMVLPTGSLRSFLRTADGWIVISSFSSTVRQASGNTGLWIRTKTELPHGIL